MADPYRSAQKAPAGPAQADRHAPSDPPRDGRGRRHLNEYDPRSRTAVTPLLLIKSLDRIEALMRAGTPDAFQRAQQELHAMAKFMRQAGARTDEEASRREMLLRLLDQFKQRVDAMATRHASAAEGFAPFKAATTRSRALTESPAVSGERPAPNGIVSPPLLGDASGVTARLPSVAPGFSVPAGGPVHAREPMAGAAPDAPHPPTSSAQAIDDENAYVPFEIQSHVEAVPAAEPATADEVNAPATRMPKTAYSVAQRMAAGNVLPALADLTEEERLALFT